jgi:hypothetical protein
MSRILALLADDPAVLIVVLLALATLCVVIPSWWRGVPTAATAPSFLVYAVRAWIAPTMLSGLSVACAFLARHPAGDRSYARFAGGGIAIGALALLCAAGAWSRRTRRPPNRSGAI